MGARVLQTGDRIRVTTTDGDDSVWTITDVHAAPSGRRIADLVDDAGTRGVVILDADGVRAANTGYTVEFIEPDADSQTFADLCAGAVAGARSIGTTSALDTTPAPVGFAVLHPSGHLAWQGTVFPTADEAAGQAEAAGFPPAVVALVPVAVTR